MFTGIVQKVAEAKVSDTFLMPNASLGDASVITKVSDTLAFDLVIHNPFTGDPTHEALSLGESIAVNGVCLTVTEFTSEAIHFNVSPETVNRTALSRLKSGRKVNLERSLRMGDRLSGHWVQGHVDGVAKLVEVTEVTTGYYDVTIEVQDPKLTKYCVKKGSICVEGISLTIHDINANRLKFQIIPHTWSQTNLVDLKPRDLVNIEVDLVAKYIERFQGYE